MIPNIFPPRSLPRTLLTAVQLAGLGVALAGFTVARVAAQTPQIPNAPTVPDAPTLPAPAIVRAPLPPSASQEIIEERPSSQHLWVAGHWRWQDGNYVWIASHWELPPRANVTWVEPHWEQKSNGYVLASGYWQEAGPAGTAAAPVVTPSPAPGAPGAMAPYGPQPQEVVVMEAPPPVMREVIVERPSPRHVWVSGYWAWRGGRHVWIGGRWELPPRDRAEWVDAHWEHRSNGYVFIDGFWRDAGVSIGVSIGGPPPPPPGMVVIREGPPPPRREYYNERDRPSPRHIWVAGYWRHDGRAYVWMSGHWDLPPRPRAAWVEPRWENRGGTYVFIEGHWR